MSNHQSNNYPYSIVPQFRSPKPEGTIPMLSCPDDFSKQFIIIDQNHLVVVKGWDWKAKFDISEFFIPNESYQIYEFILKYDSDYSKYVTIQYPNSETTQFICIFPMYHNTMDFDNQHEWKLYWQYYNDPSFIDSTNLNSWKGLGRILMLSGTDDKPINKILLQNRTGEDITLKILIGN